MAHIALVFFELHKTFCEYIGNRYITGQFYLLLQHDGGSAKNSRHKPPLSHMILRYI
ncbi:hypothetical protein B0I35DRAFT_443674 [Stachybotrys elegans]|uniref:Uncharacterized protein n=1 Tax=Stachybotrys elegans TaxID=80388 RepID=A0A8K0SBZ1_9HYPO|nr:hypothetical protein B0I35DRAFT_443674 [Stachybotrys elegans]